jgi:hypothetical protein
LALWRGINLCREGGQKGSRMAAFLSSSLHNKARVSLFLPSYRARGRSLGSRRVRWWCGSEMRWQGEAGVVCGLINGVVVVYGGLGPF